MKVRWSLRDSSALPQLWTLLQDRVLQNSEYGQRSCLEQSSFLGHESEFSICHSNLVGTCDFVFGILVIPLFTKPFPHRLFVIVFPVSNVSQ